jgi:hypothetical protein
MANRGLAIRRVHVRPVAAIGEAPPPLEVTNPSLAINTRKHWGSPHITLRLF